MSVQTAPRIESSDMSLADLFKDFYSVPDFQREYVWEQSNVDQLLGDIYEEFVSEDGHVTNDSEYFIGSVVVCPSNDGTYHLIDGQQRLTTSYLVLCAIRDSLKELGDGPSTTLQFQIAATSASPQTGYDVFRYRLALQYDDSEHVLEKIAGAQVRIEDITATTASVRHILSAYQIIREFLSVNLRDDATEIRKFMVAFTFNVKLIRIVTPDLSHALKVFETINDRGVGLNAMDLLKNLLFIKTPSDDYQLLKNKWKILIDTLEKCGEKPLRFLRYFIISQYETDWRKGLREDQIYGWFVENADECGITSAPLSFVDLLIARSRAYANFVANNDVQDESNRYLKNIAKLSGAVRQHFILLLAGQHLQPDLFTELCRRIENLFFCYIVTREPTKTFEHTFARLSGKLRTVTNADQLMAFFAEYFDPDISSRSANFDFAFSQLSQARIQQYRMRYILAKLTQYIDEQAWASPSSADLDGYLNHSVHIEHILPQDPLPDVRAAFDMPDEYESYVGMLGNLTLLEATINTSVSNNGYQMKREGFRQSAFLLTKSLVEKPHVGTNTSLNRAVEDLTQFDLWDSTSIKRRQEMLSRLARKVWHISGAANT